MEQKIRSSESRVKFAYARLRRFALQRTLPSRDGFRQRQIQQKQY